MAFQDVCTCVLLTIVVFSARWRQDEERGRGLCTLTGAQGRYFSLEAAFH